MLANLALALEYEASCRLAEPRLAASIVIRPASSSMRCWPWDTIA
jgi:hypothetical protein